MIGRTVTTHRTVSTHRVSGECGCSSVPDSATPIMIPRFREDRFRPTGVTPGLARPIPKLPCTSLRRARVSMSFRAFRSSGALNDICAANLTDVDGMCAFRLATAARSGAADLDEFLARFVGGVEGLWNSNVAGPVDAACGGQYGCGIPNPRGNSHYCIAGTIARWFWSSSNYDLVAFTVDSLQRWPIDRMGEPPPQRFQFMCLECTTRSLRVPRPSVFPRFPRLPPP